MTHVEELKSSGGIWNHNHNPTWYDNSAMAQCVTARPETFVCPSSSSEPTIDFTPARAAEVGPPQVATGSYALCTGSLGPSHASGSVPKCANDGMFMYVVRRKVGQITDGTSKTLAAGEVTDSHKKGGLNLWSLALRHRSSLRSTEVPMNTPIGLGAQDEDPPSEEASNGCFSSDHGGGAHFVFVDGHVRFLSENIDHITNNAYATIAKGEANTQE